MKQLSLDYVEKNCKKREVLDKSCREFGGELHVKGRRKSARPMSSKHALHLVLRADTSRTGSIRKYKKGISALMRTVPRRNE